MQPTEFVQAGRKLLEAIPPQLVTIGGQGPKELHDMLTASHQFASVQPALASDKNIVKFAAAFGIDLFLDPEFPSRLIMQLVSGKSSENDIPMLARPYHNAMAAVNVVEALLIPKVVVEEVDFDDTLTIQLDLEKDVTADVVAQVLTKVNELYHAVARMTGKEADPLQIVYAASGSPLRFDLRGLGPAIKRTKELIIEVWNHARYCRQEDLRQNGMAMWNALKLVQEIDALREKEIITLEDAGMLKQTIINSTLVLFEHGALPREVKKEETVQNLELLKTVATKLLPAPPEPKIELAKAPAPKAAKTKTKKKEIEE